MTAQRKIKALHDGLANPSQESMAEILERYHYADIASAISAYADADIIRLLSFVTVQKRARLFGYLPKETQMTLLNELGDELFSQLFLHMQHDKRASLFNRLSNEQKQRLEPLLAWSDRLDISLLSSYDDKLVGSIMTSDYALIGADQSAYEAVAQLRQLAPSVETIYQAFVVDAEHRLIGTVSLRELLIAPPEQQVGEFMVSNPVAINVLSPREDAAKLVWKYDLLVLPVIDNEQRLVGIVTYDDAMDVASEEVNSDFQKVGGVEDFVGSIKDAAISILYRKRVFWLVLLVFGNLFSGAGIALFEDVIAANVVLVFFLPLLIGSGGNAGSQSATLMVRALATGDVQPRDWGWLMVRELIVAGLLGLTMALAVSVLGFWRGGYEIALVVGLTMQIIVVVGSLIGLSLPFVLHRINMDPATASAPLVTSIADACGVLVYFGMASYWLNL